ncbi:MAG: hypothetical protein KHW43_03395 [Neisseria sp.]|nr:hypothetical protein [Neisseria sp.]
MKYFRNLLFIALFPVFLLLMLSSCTPSSVISDEDWKIAENTPLPFSYIAPNAHYICIQSSYQPYEDFISSNHLPHIPEKEFSMLTQDGQEIWWLFSTDGKVQEKRFNGGKYPKISQNQSFCANLQNACLFVDKRSSEKRYEIRSCINLKKEKI